MKVSALILALSTLAFGCFAADEAKEAAAPVPAIKGPVLSNLYKSIKPEELGNPIKMVGHDWMLISAGNQEKFNAMTASWGGWGVWNKPVAFILVHSDRYTYQFLEKEENFTLSFYPEKYKDAALNKIFGHMSGRNVDKTKESGFTPIFTNPGMAYAEASIIIVCKKRYGVFTGGENKSHKLYFGDILSVWVKKDVK